MKIITILLALLYLPSYSQEIKYKRTEVDSEIILELPETFYLMPFEDGKQRVASYRKPTALYSDQDRLVEFGVNKSFSKWYSDDLELLQSFVKASLLNLYSNVEMLNEEIVDVNGRRFIIFEFDSKVAGPADSNLTPIKKYTLLYYTLYNGQTILFNFSVHFYEKDYWQPIAQSIMSSIKIK